MVSRVDTDHVRKVSSSVEKIREQVPGACSPTPAYLHRFGRGRKDQVRQWDPLSTCHTYYEDDLGCVWHNVRDENLDLKYIRRDLELDVDIMWFHGDIKTQHGLMFSTAVFRKILKPAYTEMFQACRKSGVHVWYSFDGNLLEIVDDLIECGVFLYDPQVRANTIDRIARAYSGRICAVAGSVQWQDLCNGRHQWKTSMEDSDEQVLLFYSPGDIDRQIEEIDKKMGAFEGSLVISAIPSEDVPLENIESVCCGWEKHCQYNWP